MEGHTQSALENIYSCKTNEYIGKALYYFEMRINNERISCPDYINRARNAIWDIFSARKIVMNGKLNENLFSDQEKFVFKEQYRNLTQPINGLVATTGVLIDAEECLRKTANNIKRGQEIFTKFLETDARMEEKIQDQFVRIDQAGENALNIINKI
jgi:hypothetical protein